MVAHLNLKRFDLKKSVKYQNNQTSTAYEMWLVGGVINLQQVNLSSPLGQFYLYGCTDILLIFLSQIVLG